MSKIEQSERIRINVSDGDLLDMRVLDDKRRLAISEHPDFDEVPEEAMGLLKTVMVAHLIAPFFPKIIETNFGVTEKVFIDELYKYYGYRPPILEINSQFHTKKKISSDRKNEIIEVANAHSGGLDSAYRVAKMKSENEDVLAVHLRNLNGKNNYAESVASRKQCNEWGIPYEQIRLINNSRNSGFDTMRTRDFLLAIVTAVTAYPYGSKKVLIEGGMIDDPAKGHFSENTQAWSMFNKLIADVNLKMKVEGIDPGDVETVGEVIKLERKTGMEIIPLVQNCFSAPYQLPNSRNKWVRETPMIAKNSSEHWCGSCLKCRRMTLGRLYYGDPRFNSISSKEVEYFVNDTYKWLKEYRHNGDMVSPSFLKHLARL